MKMRLLSTLTTLASVAGMAHASLPTDVRVITSVRDGSGQYVQGVSLKFYGPFGVSNRRSEMSTATGRNGESDKMMAPGRYLVFASDNERGIDSRTFEVGNRGGAMNLDLRLRPTRRPTIQFVVMSDDLNQPVSNATIDILNRETGRRDSLRSSGSGLTQFDLASRTSGGSYDVRISSNDFDTKNVNVRFSPSTDTSSAIAYIELRRKTGTRGGPIPSSQSNDLPKLDGMIRLSNKNRVEAGDVVTVDVGLVLMKGFSERSQCVSTVTISGPNGGSILSDSRNVKLVLNEYATTKLDLTPRSPGTYTVTVSAIMANGSGVQNSRWDGKFTFNVHPQSGNANNSKMVIDRGDYLGISDIEMDNRDIKSHTLSLTISRGSRNLDNVKGWLSPKSGLGFHMMFNGTFDQATGRLDARGTMSDREDKRWDIRLTGSPDRNGRMSMNLSIRALDNSYSRSFNYLLTKK